MVSWPIVLFDLDGTITDPTPGFTASITHALETVGVGRVDETMLRAMIGPPLQEGLAGAGVPPDRIDEAIDAYRERYGAGAMHDAPLHDGIVEVLTELVRTGRVVGLATSKPWVYAEQILERIDLRDRFTVVGGAELDGTRRAKADVIEWTLAELGGPAPSDVVLVGDRRQDVDGARANGIAVIGVTWGFAVDGELDGADVVVHHAAGLTDALGLTAAGERHRRAARVLIVDDADRVLLLRWEPRDTGPAWLVPGGGIEPGETVVEAARRELAEEIGLTGVEVGPTVLTRQWTTPPGHRHRSQRESWRLVRVTNYRPPPVEQLPEAVVEGITETRWVTMDELEATIGESAPEMVEPIRSIVRDGVPDRPFGLNALLT